MTSIRPTNQDQPDGHFEEHLRGFRPVSPRTLVMPRHRERWKAMAVAAGVLLAASISFFVRHQRPIAVPHAFASSPITIGALNAALRDNDETLNRLLDDASPNILPHSPHGTVLYELGKE